MPRFRLTTAAMAGLLTIATTAAAAAAPAAKPAPIKQTCKLGLAEQVPIGATAVDPAAQQGTEVGSISCGKQLGQGVTTMAFRVPADGSLQGAYKAYFNAGSLHGRYVLIPGDSAPTSQSSFATERFTGTLTVLGGTGAFAQAKGTGTLRCVSADGVHLTCVEHMKLRSL